MSGNGESTTYDPVVARVVNAALEALQNGRVAEVPEMLQAELREAEETAEYYFLLGVTAFFLNDYGRALEFLGIAHDLDPEAREYADALAHVHARVGQLTEGIYYAKLATALDAHPLFAQVSFRGLDNFQTALSETRNVNYLAEVLAAMGERRYADAIALAEKDLRLNTQDAELYQTMGQALLEQGEISRALGALHVATQRDPDSGRTAVLLGRALRRWGQAEEARLVQEMGLARELDATLLALASDDAVGEEEIWPGLDELTVLWRENLDLSSPATPPAPLDGRPLQVGVVTDAAWESDGLRLLTPLIRHLGAEDTEVSVLSWDVAGPLGRSSGLERLVSRWTNVADIDDETLAVILEAEGLDLVVDLTFEADTPWPGALARQPVPAVVSLLGRTAGIFGAGLTHQLVDEGGPTPRGPQPVVQPGGVMALAPDTMPAPVLTPAERPGGGVVLGASADLALLTPTTVALWSFLLRAIPQARLLLGNRSDLPGSLQDRILERFANFGVMGRVGFADMPADGTALAERRQAYLAQVDMVLDPSPRSDGMLLVDALWNGVPVLHLGADQSFGAHVLRAAGRDSWITGGLEGLLEQAALLVESGVGQPAFRETLHREVRESALFNPAAHGERLRATLHAVAREVLGAG